MSSHRYGMLKSYVEWTKSSQLTTEMTGVNPAWVHGNRPEERFQNSDIYSAFEAVNKAINAALADISKTVAASVSSIHSPAPSTVSSPAAAAKPTTPAPSKAAQPYRRTAGKIWQKDEEEPMEVLPADKPAKDNGYDTSSRATYLASLKKKFPWFNFGEQNLNEDLATDLGSKMTALRDTVRKIFRELDSKVASTAPPSIEKNEPAQDAPAVRSSPPTEEAPASSPEEDVLPPNPPSLQKKRTTTERDFLVTNALTRNEATQRLIGKLTEPGVRASLEDIQVKLNTKRLYQEDKKSILATLDKLDPEMKWMERFGGKRGWRSYVSEVVRNALTGRASSLVKPPYIDRHSQIVREPEPDEVAQAVAAEPVEKKPKLKHSLFDDLPSDQSRNWTVS